MGKDWFKLTNIVIVILCMFIVILLTTSAPALALAVSAKYWSVQQVSFLL